MPSFVKQSAAVQLSEKLADLIRQGIWPTDEKVPAIRQLATEFQVSVTTAHNALRLLEQAGVLDRRPRGSSFVRPDLRPAPPTPRPERRHIAMLGAVGATPAQPKDTWQTYIMSAAEAELFQSGRFYITRVGSTEPNPQRYIAELVEQLQDLSSQLAGAIFFGANQMATYTGVTTALDELDLPWISINRPSDRIAHNYVSADHHRGGLIAGRALALMQFRRVALVGPSFGRAFSFRQKAAGLFDSFLAAGLPTTGIVHVETAGYEVADGEEAMANFLRNHQPPEAIFGIGDPVAIGAMRACQEQGVCVPDELAVIGSTGLELAEYCSPSLTVVPQAMRQVGQAAARRLLRMIRKNRRRVPGVRIGARMILRESFQPSAEARRTLQSEGMLRKSRRVVVPEMTRMGTQGVGK